MWFEWFRRSCRVTPFRPSSRVQTKKLHTPVFGYDKGKPFFRRHPQNWMLFFFFRSILWRVLQLSCSSWILAELFSSLLQWVFVWTLITPSGLSMITDLSGLRARPSGAARLQAGPSGLMNPRSCRVLQVWLYRKLVNYAKRGSAWYIMRGVR